MIQAIIGRLEREIQPQADRIMTILLQLLKTASAKSSVPDTVFAAVGALANALEEAFEPYMESFVPFLYDGLNNQEEASLCSMSIGLTSDITRALGVKIQPFCDNLMNCLLNDLRSTTLGNQFKPAILQCFGDIAQAIGGHFETYLGVVAQVLQQAAGVNISQETSYEMLDYIISLREGIMDAWAGIIAAIKAGGKRESEYQSKEHNTRMLMRGLEPLLQQYVESIFQLLHIVHADPNRTEALLRSAMGVIG